MLISDAVDGVYFRILYFLNQLGGNPGFLIQGWAWGFSQIPMNNFKN
jgi:hypothetical protein